MPTALPHSPATDPAAWRALVGRQIPRGYAAGIELLQQGNAVDSVYLLAKGLIKLTDTQADGRVTILGLRSDGWVVGAAAAIRECSCPFTATTLTRCHLHWVRADRFRSYLRRNAQLSWYLHDIQAHELLEQMSEEVTLRTLSARVRLERFLVRVLRAQSHPVAPGIGVRLILPLRLWEVAQLIAVTPTYLSDLIGQLESEGLVRRTKGSLTVLKPDQLDSGAQ